MVKRIKIPDQVVEEAVTVEEVVAEEAVVAVGEAAEVDVEVAVVDKNEYL